MLRYRSLFVTPEPQAKGLPVDASLSLGTTKWGTFLNSPREDERGFNKNILLKAFIVRCPTAV